MPRSAPTESAVSTPLKVCEDRRLPKEQTVRRLTTLVVSLLVIAAAAAIPAGARDVSKQVIKIDIGGAPQGGNPSGGGGVFTLRAAGRSDKGTDSYSFANGVGTVYLNGKHGQLVVRLKARSSGLEVDSEGLDLWTGTWKIVSGTGSYATAHGVGAYVGIVGPSYRVALHLEGFLS
jgi:hypothetical protein